MKLTIIILLTLASCKALAYKPYPCPKPLQNLVVQLFKEDLLSKKVTSAPGEDYTTKFNEKVRAKKCKVKDKELTSNTKASWYVHSNHDGVTIIIEKHLYHPTPTEYYGPFKLIYKTENI